LQLVRCRFCTEETIGNVPVVVGGVNGSHKRRNDPIKKARYCKWQQICLASRALLRAGDAGPIGSVCGRVLRTQAHKKSWMLCDNDELHLRVGHPVPYKCVGLTFERCDWPIASSQWHKRRSSGNDWKRGQPDIEESLVVLRYFRSIYCMPPRVLHSVGPPSLNDPLGQYKIKSLKRGQIFKNTSSTSKKWLVIGSRHEP
jgi:hypothetical protein